MEKELVVTPEGAKGTTDILPIQQPSACQQVTMWSDAKLMQNAWRTAEMLSKSGLVPQNYQNQPANCLIAMDIANRMNVSPIFCMQNLYVVQGKPAWSGSFCVAAINGCGKFTPLSYVFVDDGGGGCYAEATRIKDGKLCRSDTITMQMANDEGWLNKNGSKWKTFPKQMMMYRAASFFARAYCPEILLGIQTVDEIEDVKGAEPEKTKTVITLED